VLAPGVRCGTAAGAEERAPTSSSWEGLRSIITSESVITSLAGFEVAFPLAEGFGVSGLVLGWHERTKPTKKKRGVAEFFPKSTTPNCDLALLLANKRRICYAFARGSSNVHSCGKGYPRR